MGAVKNGDRNTERVHEIKVKGILPLSGAGAEVLAKEPFKKQSKIVQYAFGVDRFAMRGGAFRGLCPPPQETKFLDFYSLLENTSKGDKNEAFIKVDGLV